MCEDDDKEDDEDLHQARGQGITEQDRYRVTFEACQEIHDFFKEGVDPKGAIGKSKLVIPGAHARLSNISDNHRIIEDEAYVYAGKDKVRPAGKKVPQLMKHWVKLRRENPEVRKMLEKVEVYQQPAGFVDNVIFSWITKEQAKTCVGSVEQRDLFASPLSENGKAVSFLSHQVQTFIAGKMSAALQLTDTHFSFMIKACSRRCKENIKREMRAQAEEDRVKHPVGFKCGPYEILRIAFEAHEYMEQKNIAENTVLAGMRQNYMLSYRPNLRTGKMERCDTQAWCKEEADEERKEKTGRMSEGSHRIQNSWCENRYNWLNEQGRPNPPEWQKCGQHVKSAEDMEDATAHGEIGEKIELKSWESDSVLKEGIEEHFVVIDDVCEDVLKGLESAAFLQSVKARRQKIKIDKLLTKQADKNDQEQSKKQQKRQMIRRAVTMASAEWRKEQHELMKKFSRKQLLSIFIPTAGRDQVKAKKQTDAQKEIEQTAKKVLKSQAKSQVKWVKAKLLKEGKLKEGLAMGLSDKDMVTPKKTEEQQQAKKKLESGKRSFRRAKSKSCEVMQQPAAEKNTEKAGETKTEEAAQTQNADDVKVKIEPEDSSMKEK